eukprot:1194489-Prorocentrum_minimum.AAC.4
MTTLHQAAEAGSLDLIDALLEHGASIAAQDKVRPPEATRNPFYFRQTTCCLLNPLYPKLTLGLSFAWDPHYYGENHPNHVLIGQALIFRPYNLVGRPSLRVRVSSKVGLVVQHLRGSPPISTIDRCITPNTSNIIRHPIYSGTKYIILHRWASRLYTTRQNQTA